MSDKYAWLSQTPIMDPDWSSPTAQAQRREDDQPEHSRMVDGEEYMTVAEYVRRVDPIFYPSAPNLISSSGYDRTYAQLGKKAAEEGRLMRVKPVEMSHPEYGTVNGWPARVLDATWSKFKMHYRLDWHLRDPEVPSTPEPYEMPPAFYNAKIADQVRRAAQRRGIDFKVSRDPRWRGALSVMLEERKGETPQQALIRRTSAAGVMFAIEKEYEQ